MTVSKIAVFDLDGTIADCNHRLHLIQNKPKNFRKFYELCSDDTPIKPVIQILGRLYHSDVDIRFLTGRSEECRNQTIHWINKHVFADTRSDQWIDSILYMRPEKDYRPDYVVKPELYDKMIADYQNWTKANRGSGEYQLIGIFEDRTQVVNAWKDRGLFVFNVNQTKEDY